MTIAVTRYSRPLRVAAGLLIVLHGLSHAVFALRGSAGLQPTLTAANALMIAYSLALLFFVAAGVGIIGSRILFPFHIPLLSVAVSLSIVTLALGWQADLWFGALVDAGVVVYLLLHHAGYALPARDRGRFLVRTSEGFGIVFVLYVGLGAVLWPWHRTWGTTEADWKISLPGDPVNRLTSAELMHGVSIDAPAWVVWAWLVQIGQDRAGFYSYDGLERLFGARIRNANELRAEWQHREAGDFVPATGRGYLGGLFGDHPGWKVTEVQECRAMVLENWGTFAVVPDGEFRSRLLVRSRIGHRHAPAWGAALSFLTFEIPHFVMERGMMLGIKQRAESPHGQIGVSRCG